MLYCPECKKKYKSFRYLCECGSILLWESDKLSWKPKGEGVWRYQSLLPVKKKTSMEEGNTPIVKAADFPGYNMYYKLEGDNPTGSFKDRGTTVVLSHALQLKKKRVSTASTGNMGASVAAYAAHANVKARVFVPSNTVINKLSQIIAHGAEVKKVKGSYQDCVKRLWKDVEKGSYLAGTGLNPYYLEGEKTIGYELYEDIGVPDKIFVPLGTGGILTAIHKAFWELKKMKVTRKMPQMIGVQPSGCCPIYDAWKNDSEVKPVKKCKTIASAILVKTPFNGNTAISAIRETKGFCVKVTEKQILSAIKDLGKEGVFAEAASATTLAAVKKKLKPGKEKIALIITGHGLKQPSLVLEK